jgi:hypothetical protein
MGTNSLDVVGRQRLQFQHTASPAAHSQHPANAILPIEGIFTGSRAILLAHDAERAPAWLNH